MTSGGTVDSPSGLGGVKGLLSKSFLLHVRIVRRQIWLLALVAMSSCVSFEILSDPGLDQGLREELFRLRPTQDLELFERPEGKCPGMNQKRRKKS